MNANSRYFDLNVHNIEFATELNKGIVPALLDEDGYTNAFVFSLEGSHDPMVISTNSVEYIEVIGYDDPFYPPLNK